MYVQMDAWRKQNYQDKMQKKGQCCSEQIISIVFYTQINVKYVKLSISIQYEIYNIKQFKMKYFKNEYKK